jgi:pimeloyl-[acyl-carrier protein] synthase
MTGQALTAGLDFDLGDMDAIGDGLLHRLDAIRDSEPVFWSQINHGWFVTRYKDVADGFMAGKYPLSNVRLGKLAFAAIPEDQWAERIPLLTGATPTFANMTDPPYHQRLRKGMNRAFSQRIVEATRNNVRSRLAELIAEHAHGGEMEFVSAIARPLTGVTIMSLMGMPMKYLPRLQDWANQVVAAIGTPRPTPQLLEKGEESMREMDSAFSEELEKRTKSPSDDFLSVLAQAAEGPDGLTHMELLGTCVNTLLAGHESTAATMALGTAALARHPEQADYLRQNRDRRMPEMLDEIGRYVAMSASQTRVAAADFEWHNRKIGQGDIVYLWNCAAGRDPQVIERPDQFDLSRDAGNSLVFGRGIHFCVGHLLAKLQLGEFFPAFFDAFRVTVLDDPLDWAGGYAFRPLNTLNLNLHSRKAS